MLLASHKKPRKPFMTVIRKRKVLSEPTPIPAHIEGKHIPPAYAEGAEPHAETAISNWDYNNSWRWGG